MESEESEDYVHETLTISQEEADENGFVPSALSDFQKLFTGVTIDAAAKP